MAGPSERERFLRRFHARHPGITSRALARTGSYERLAERVQGRVLDLGCGDGHLVELLARRGCTATGIDLSAEELRLAPPGRCVQGRAQALPFAAGAFDAATSHFAFMLLDSLDEVVAELRRVVVPGGRFVALLGGGPTADGPGSDGDDAFHRFLALARPHLGAPVRFGDPRAKSEAGWRALFGGTIAFERLVLDLSGTFEQVWAFLGASYELDGVDAASLRDELHATAPRDPTGRVRCHVVAWLASTTL